MSLTEYVKVQKGGITMEVRRGEAQRYVRLGFVRVEETLVPDKAPDPNDLFVIHDGHLPVKPALPAVEAPVEEPTGTDEQSASEPEAPKRRRASSRKKGDAT